MPPQHFWHRLAAVAVSLVGLSACGDADSLDRAPPHEVMSRWLDADATVQAAYFARIAPDRLVPSLLQELSEVTGLPVLRDVPMTVLAAAEQDAKLKASIEASEQRLPHIKEMSIGLEAAADGLELKALQQAAEEDAAADGDEESDDGTLSGAGNQAVVLGFYDTVDKTFVMRSDLSPHDQLHTMRHELVHALQDQSYLLDDMLAGCLPNFDCIMAVKAVIEGQATLVPEIVLASRQSKAQKAHGGRGPTLTASLAQTRLEPAMLALRRRAHHERGPRALIEQLLTPRRHTDDSAYVTSLDVMLFPYRQGAEFMYRLAAGRSQVRLNKWIKTTFEQPPESTAEILHPERYRRRLAGKAVPALNTEGLASAPLGELLWRSPLGELVMRDYLGASGKFWLAQHLERDELFVFEQAGSAKPLLIWLTAWNSIASASVFAEVAGVKQSGLATTASSAGEQAFASRTARRGRTVAVVAGLVSGEQAPQLAYADEVERAMQDALAWASAP